MSKQYRHKQTGIIAEQGSTFGRPNNLYYIKGKCYSLPKELVENSNDWVEITKCDKCNSGSYHDDFTRCTKCGTVLTNECKKNYEILSFYMPESSLKAEIQKDGTYKMLSRNTSIGGSTLSAMLGLNMWRIHSVKRLSDGEVFTVGDKIRIYSFCEHGKISQEGIITKFKDIDGVMGGECLKFFKHAKQPLFKTEDGVYIYEGDKYWCINMGYGYNAREIKCANSDKIEVVETIKRFSTKEAAEEYILMNKPVLSAKELLDSGLVLKGDIGPLKQLVKSRLNV